MGLPENRAQCLPQRELIRLTDHANTVEHEADELAQAAKFAHIAMMSPVDYAGEFSTGMFSVLELSAQRLHLDANDLARRAREAKSKATDEIQPS